MCAAFYAAGVLCAVVMEESSVGPARDTGTSNVLSSFELNSKPHEFHAVCIHSLI